MVPPCIALPCVRRDLQCALPPASKPAAALNAKLGFAKALGSAYIHARRRAMRVRRERIHDNSRPVKDNKSNAFAAPPQQRSTS